MPQESYRPREPLATEAGLLGKDCRAQIAEEALQESLLLMLSQPLAKPHLLLMSIVRRRDSHAEPSQIPHPVLFGNRPDSSPSPALDTYVKSLIYMTHLL